MRRGVSLMLKLREWLEIQAAGWVPEAALQAAEQRHLEAEDRLRTVLRALDAAEQEAERHKAEAERLVEALRLNEAALEAAEHRAVQAEITWREPREGLATVYDSERRYLGCLGVEFWDWLVKHNERDVMDAWQRADAAERENRALREMK